MANKSKCNNLIYSENRYEYLIEYRGNFLEQMEKVDYACGYIITEKFAIVYIEGDRVYELAKAVPAILFVNYRSVFVLEGTSVEDVSNIKPIKINPYLDLKGSGVIVGIVDTGIDYMNKEFIREDDTSRIEAIWDQTIIESNEEVENNTVNGSNEINKTSNSSRSVKDVFTGKVYLNDEINKAILESRQGKDPYEIVPSKDTIGHGTQIASVAGARGYDKDVEGVANDCNFVIVKLRESPVYEKELRENNLPYVPLYNNAMLVSGFEYLKQYAIAKKKPMVILGGIGSPDHSHDGSDLFSRYIDELGSYRGIVFVTGCGNEGAAEGHTSGFISAVGDSITRELNISKKMKSLSFRIWVRKPNKMALVVISPSGQTTKIIEPKFNEEEEIKFIYEDTNLKVRFFVPDNITGLQVIFLDFTDIKPGVWKFELIGRYIVGGRFDIWLPPHNTLPADTKFLQPDPDQTINTEGSARKAIAVGYYNQENDSIVSESGRGFPLYGVIKPDIAAPGINIIATSIGDKKVEITGSSAAAAIVTGVSALLLQWGIVKGNDSTMYTPKIISYLVTGALRDKNTDYPNKSLGYGKLDLVGVFNYISGIITNYRSISEYIEYNIEELFVRIPSEMVVKNHEKRI